MCGSSASLLVRCVVSKPHDYFVRWPELPCFFAVKIGGEFELACSQHVSIIWQSRASCGLRQASLGTQEFGVIRRRSVQWSRPVSFLRDTLSLEVAPDHFEKS